MDGEEITLIEYTNEKKEIKIPEKNTFLDTINNVISNIGSSNANIFSMDETIKSLEIALIMNKQVRDSI